MTLADQLRLIVRRVVTKLVDGDFVDAVAECDSSRLSANDLERVIREYGRTFVEPPPNAYTDLDIVVVSSADLPTWSVRAPLWSREEGQSDLTLKLTVRKDRGKWSADLDDLRVP
jgi:hypothetical protein